MFYVVVDDRPRAVPLTAAAVCNSVSERMKMLIIALSLTDY